MRFLLALALFAFACLAASAQPQADGAVSPSESANDDVPVLVMHLPDWERKVGEGAVYAVSLPALQQAAGNRPALDVVSFGGGAEAVTAKYDDARLVIVEFTTPQYAANN